MVSGPRGEKIKNLARKEESDGKTGRIEGKSDVRALNGFKRRTGERNWCFTCNSESNFAPNCPSQGTLGEGSAPPTPFWNKPPRPPCCSIAMESPISLRNDGFPEKKDTAGIREQSLYTTLDLDGQFLCMRENSVVALDSVAAANLLCFGRLGGHNLRKGKQGLLRISTYSASARAKFGDAHLGEVRLFAGFTFGIAGR